MSTILDRIRPHLQLHPTGTFRSGWVFVTPEMAKEMLELRNPNNRNINKPTLHQLIEDMKNGEYHCETANPISFSKLTKMINGHTITTAIVRSGVPDWFFIETDVEPEVFTVFDIGPKRTIGDSFKMEGIPSPFNTGSIVNKYLVYKAGGTSYIPGTSKNRTFPIKQLLAEYYSSPEYWQHIEAFSRSCHSMYKGYKLLSGKAIVGAKYALYSNKQINPQVEEFFKQVCSGVNALPGSPTFTVRNRLMGRSRDYISDPKKAWKREHQSWCLDKAWNMFVKGETSKQFRRPDGYVQPIILNPTLDI